MINVCQLSEKYFDKKNISGWYISHIVSGDSWFISVVGSLPFFHLQAQTEGQDWNAWTWRSRADNNANKQIFLNITSIIVLTLRLSDHWTLVWHHSAKPPISSAVDWLRENLSLNSSWKIQRKVNKHGCSSVELKHDFDYLFMKLFCQFLFKPPGPN